MRRLLWQNGLSITLLVLFLAFTVGQSLAGLHEHNRDREQHGDAPLRYGEYLTSGHFLSALFENWESEFLQMGAYVILTVFLRQKGSSESKRLDGPEKVDADPRAHQGDPESPLPVRRGGWMLRLYEHSLSLAFGALFLLSFALHAVASWRLHREELLDHADRPIGFADFLASSELWFESFQNWQSEFLAVAAIVVLSVFLRERGSPESKPVATPHHETGTG